jgi:hypothetical protein
LTKALRDFLRQYRPILKEKDYNVNNVPDYDELLRTQGDLDSLSSAEIKRRAIENRKKYEPHGIETIYTRSKPKP